MSDTFTKDELDALNASYEMVLGFFTPSPTTDKLARDLRVTVTKFIIARLTSDSTPTIDYKQVVRHFADFQFDAHAIADYIIKHYQEAVPEDKGGEE